MPKDASIRKVLVIGSGPIVIGQAAEFDYAGAQACRVLKEEGVEVVLVNSNPATIMTDQHLADHIYLEPMNAPVLRRIIEKERPDGLLAGLGGQTALTLAMQLSRDGTLDEFGVRLLGSSIVAIEKAEDREQFRNTMQAIGQPCVPSQIAETLDSAQSAAREIGYPVIVRPAYTLGGTGGGICEDEAALLSIAKAGLDASPIHQILVEKCIAGWKEIEFETLRDHVGNAIAVCSMENVDPVGIHTGDSIVVAPTLTLSDKEFQMLRSASLQMIAAIGIEGGCNCQFALNPESFEYAVIEVNPRVSRSSALASKATGYPIAKITTRIALGYTLDELRNDVTGQTSAFFEPTLDYVVVKIPKWPFDKFQGTSRSLGTQMKATGEVMAIGQSFEEALMKAVRGAEIGLDTLNAPPLTDDPVSVRLTKQDDHRLFTVFEALKAGMTVDAVFTLTKIDRWFLSRLQAMAMLENRINHTGLQVGNYEQLKRWGYPDGAIRRLFHTDHLPDWSASYKMVDTCGAEFDAETPYFYSCFGGECESREFARSGKPVVMVPGMYLYITARMRMISPANVAQERSDLRCSVKNSLVGKMRSSTCEYTTDPEKRMMTTNGARMVMPMITPIILRKLLSRSTFHTLLNTCRTEIIRDSTIQTKEAMEIKPNRPLSAVLTMLSAAPSSTSVRCCSPRLAYSTSANLSLRPRPSVR